MAIGGEELGFSVKICCVRAGEISEGEEGRRIVGGGDSKSYRIFEAGKIVDGDFFFSVDLCREGKSSSRARGEEMARVGGKEMACGTGDRAPSPGIAREIERNRPGSCGKGGDRAGAGVEGMGISIGWNGSAAVSGVHKSHFLSLSWAASKR